TITGGPGADTINGGPGSDTIIWQIGDGVDTTIDGGADAGDRLSVTLSGNGDTAQAGAPTSGNGFQLIVPGATLNPFNIEGLDLLTAGGSDTVTTNPLGGASVLNDIFVRLGSDSVSDAVVFNGSTGSDSVTMSVTGGVVSIVRSGVTVRVDNAGSANGGASFTVNLLGSGDTFTAQQTLAGTTTTVNARPGRDPIHVGAGGQNVDANPRLL